MPSSAVVTTASTTHTNSSSATSSATSKSSSSSSTLTSTNSTTANNTQSNSPKKQKKSRGDKKGDNGNNNNKSRHINLSRNNSASNSCSTEYNIDNLPAGQRIPGVTIYRPICYGNLARKISQPNDKTCSLGQVKTDDWYEWTVYVRGPKNEDLSYFISKVVFILHSDFANQYRVVEQPPYQVTEQGWGQFDIKLRIYFHDYPPLQYDATINETKNGKKNSKKNARKRTEIEILKLKENQSKPLITFLEKPNHNNNSNNSNNSNIDDNNNDTSLIDLRNDNSNSSNNNNSNNSNSNNGKKRKNNDNVDDVMAKKRRRLNSNANTNTNNNNNNNNSNKSNNINTNINTTISGNANSFVRSDSASSGLTTSSESSAVLKNNSVSGTDWPVMNVSSSRLNENGRIHDKSFINDSDNDSDINVDFIDSGFDLTRQHSRASSIRSSDSEMAHHTTRRRSHRVRNKKSKNRNKHNNYSNDNSNKYNSNVIVEKFDNPLKAKENDEIKKQNDLLFEMIEHDSARVIKVCFFACCYIFVVVVFCVIFSYCFLGYPCTIRGEKENVFYSIVSHFYFMLCIFYCFSTLRF